MANPVPAPSDPESYEDRRLYPRVPVAMPAFIQVHGKRHSVLLLDLSAGGAKLTCPTSIRTGTEVILDCGSLGRSAVVRWQTDGVLGLRFDSELEAREISALLERSKALEELMKGRG